MDSLKRFEAYDIMTTMVMVGTQHLAALKAAAAAGGTVQVDSIDLTAATWQTLRNDVMAEQWPLDEKERQAMYRRLRREHEGGKSADRLEFLVAAYKAADPNAEAFLAAEAKAGTDEAGDKGQDEL